MSKQGYSHQAHKKNKISKCATWNEIGEKVGISYTYASTICDTAERKLFAGLISKFPQGDRMIAIRAIHELLGLSYEEIGKKLIRFGLEGKIIGELTK